MVIKKHMVDNFNGAIKKQLSEVFAKGAKPLTH